MANATSMDGVRRMRMKGLVMSLCAGALALGFLPPAFSGSRCGPIYDVDEVAAIEITGIRPYEVASVGDVNGDGIPDIGLTQHTLERAYVVYGQAEEGRINVNTMGTGGFAIAPNKPGDGALLDIGGAGDVNGDGYDDVIVGAPGADSNGRLNSGSAYVIFGSPVPAPVSLTAYDLYTQTVTGFRIDGPFAAALAGHQVDGLGDVNDDGYDDLIVGAPFANAAYVVFGKTDFLAVDLASFEREAAPDGAGYKIRTHFVHESIGFDVARAGDINGDGTPDAIVAVSRPSDPRGAYIVYGKNDSRPVDARDMKRRQGFRLMWRSEAQYQGVGDFNRDGYDDIGVGVGDVALAYGGKRPGSIPVSRLAGDRGWFVTEEFIGDSAPLGDVNGDGYADVAFGDPLADPKGREDGGSAFIVFGDSRRIPTSLRCPGAGGVRIDGTLPFANLGEHVAGPGDLNDDGLADIVVASFGEGVESLVGTGMTDTEPVVYVIWGRRKW